MNNCKSNYPRILAAYHTVKSSRLSYCVHIDSNKHHESDNFIVTGIVVFFLIRVAWCTCILNRDSRPGRARVFCDTIGLF